MRLQAGGLINRKRPVNFEFDGHRYQGFEGDTLASALLANRVRLMGRSFKYHRPRGVLTAGSEEPNALVTIGTKDTQRPNERATMQEIYEGLQSFSQNRWPSLRWDLLSINDRFSSLLSAGFYYKSFMWPKGFWERLYEPLIRRAAGLGALSGLPDQAANEKAFAFCDLLIIGAGPAGLSAALTAGRAGVRIILADEDFQMGGSLLSESLSIDGSPAIDWVNRAIEELAALPNVHMMPRTTITGIYDGGLYGAIERVGLHHPTQSDLPQECFWRITTKRAILCAGALERSIPFANNDRPGIMLSSAVRSYLNRYAVAPGKSVVVFGNNSSAHRTASDLHKAGIHVAALVDARPDTMPPHKEFRFYPGSVVLNSTGRMGLETVTIRNNAGHTEKVMADCLAISGGWNPSVHLTCHMNGRPIWDDTIASFLPKEGAIPGLCVAGAAEGRFTTQACLASGRLRATTALEALGIAPSAEPPLPKCEDTPYEIVPLWSVPGKGRAWLDLQNDVTIKDVAQAATENYRSVEHMKRYTTQGMATDQGKTSNVSALAVLANVTGRGIAQTGTTTFRPPFTPVSIAAMGAGGADKGFAPERFTTSHTQSEAHKAPMIEAGLWYRPSYFPQAGEHNWRQSCDREVGMVRNHVGVCDVSTLGKIELQGPDVGAFLDLIYTNRFSTLKPGRVRYGLMLREDGHVMDDGTTARLDENTYVMTTTTAAAGQVMRHLDFVQQAFCPKLRLRFTSITEAWAQFAIAGPKSRALLNHVLDASIDETSFGFMTCSRVSIGGVAARLFRISFSGEHGYELAVPARYGASLFRALERIAKELDGGLYGMEALNVLRIEKGFLTHAEIDGRVTAFDLGMKRMISNEKDCIGKSAAERPGLLDINRPQLVGLRPKGPVKQLLAGAHLFEAEAAPISESSQGYLSSVAYSPTLGSMIGLGFFQNGRERHGEEIKMVDHLREVEAICIVEHPIFFDREGARARD